MMGGVQVPACFPCVRQSLRLVRCPHRGAVAFAQPKLILARNDHRLHLHGNERGQVRVERTKRILAEIGLEPERLEMFFVSGGMGATFAEIAKQMTERARSLGPSPLNQPQKA